MQWVMTSHVRYYHKKNRTSGHIWQGRYKSFMVEKEYPTKKLDFEAFNTENILDLVDESKRENNVNSIVNDILKLIEIYKKRIDN